MDEKYYAALQQDILASGLSSNVLSSGLINNTMVSMQCFDVVVLPTYNCDMRTSPARRSPASVMRQRSVSWRETRVNAAVGRNLSRCSQGRNSLVQWRVRHEQTAEPLPDAA